MFCLCGCRRFNCGGFLISAKPICCWSQWFQWQLPDFSFFWRRRGSSSPSGSCLLWSGHHSWKFRMECASPFLATILKAFKFPSVENTVVVSVFCNWTLVNRKSNTEKIFKNKGLMNNSKTTKKLRWEFYSFIYSFNSLKQLPCP